MWDKIGQVAGMMIVCLIIAFILGIIFGWLLHQLFGTKSVSEDVSSDEVNGYRKRIADLEASNATQLAKLKTAEGGVSDCEKNLASAKTLATDAEAKLKGADEKYIALERKYNDYELKLNASDARVKEIEGKLALAGVAAAASAAAIQASAPKPIETDLLRIHGLEESSARKLVLDASVPNQASLLEQGASPAGRRDVAVRSSIPEAQLLKWINQIDLKRVKGVDESLASLLELAGVDTVPELSHRNATNLQLKLAEVNTEHKRVASTPSLEAVTAWVEEAKTLPRVLTY